MIPLLTPEMNYMLEKDSVKEYECDTGCACSTCSSMYQNDNLITNIGVYDGGNRIDDLLVKNDILGKNGVNEVNDFKANEQYLEQERVKEDNLVYEPSMLDNIVQHPLANENTVYQNLDMNESISLMENGNSYNAQNFNQLLMPNEYLTDNYSSRSYNSFADTFSEDETILNVPNEEIDYNINIPYELEMQEEIAMNEKKSARNSSDVKLPEILSTAEKQELPVSDLLEETLENVIREDKNSVFAKEREIKAQE